MLYCAIICVEPSFMFRLDWHGITLSPWGAEERHGIYHFNQLHASREQEALDDCGKQWLQRQATNAR